MGRDTPFKKKVFLKFINIKIVRNENFLFLEIF